MVDRVIQEGGAGLLFLEGGTDDLLQEGGTGGATAPGAPTGVSAADQHNQTVIVSFVAPASNGGSPITGYTVSPSAGGWVDSNAGSTSLAHTMTGGTLGTSVTFTATATNAIGTSSASSASAAIVPSWYASADVSKSTFTVDHTKVASGNASPRVLVKVTNNSLRTVSNGGGVRHPSGHDIVFYSDANLTAKLTAWEIEKYDGSTGELVVHCNLGHALSSASDEVFYAAFGNNAISSFQSVASSVWDSNYKGVYHLAAKSSEYVAPTLPVAPIVTTNPAVVWKSGQLANVHVFTNPSNSNQLVMLYNPFEWTGTGFTNGAVARATCTKSGFSLSSTWTDDAVNPVLHPSSFSGVTDLVPHSIVLVGSTLYLYCSAYTTVGIRCWLFTSTNAGLTWSVPTVVMTASGEGHVDSSVSGFDVMRDVDGSWHMIYTAPFVTPATSAKRYASSANGIAWTKSSGPPILTLGAAGSPDHWGYEEGNFVGKVGDYYVYLYECAISPNEFHVPGAVTEYSINVAYATTPSGPWTKSKFNPVFTASRRVGMFDRYTVGLPHIVEINGDTYLFYAGAPTTDLVAEGALQIGVMKLNSDLLSTFLPGVSDSSSTANALVVSGPSVATGQISTGLSFGGGVNERASSITPPMTVVNNFTLEAWVKPSSLSQAGLVMHVGNDNGLDSGNGYGFGMSNASPSPGAKLVGYLDLVSWVDSGYTFPDTTTARKVVMTRESGTIKFYVNNVQTANTSTATPTAPLEYFHIGASGGARYNFAGLIDEVRVSDVVRSSATRTTEYNNENDPATFYAASIPAIGGASSAQAPRTMHLLKMRMAA